MSTSEEFTLEFDGEAVQTGEMDVNDLAPSLLSFSRLCTETNAELNGDHATISVRVRADFKRGSFGVDVHMVQSVVEQIKILLGTTQVKDVKDILDTLGAMADDLEKIAIPALGLFGIAKYIGHQKVKSAEKTGPGTRIELSNNAVFLVDPAAWALYQRPQVKDDLEKFTAPLRRDGFDEIRFKKDKRVTAEITKGDALEGFTASPADTDVPVELGEILSEDEQERTWRIRQVQFDPKLTVWRFFEGDAHIRATMLDEDFIGQVLRHEQVFGNGDFLRVRVRVTTRRADDGSSNVSYSILKVLAVIVQPELPMKGPEEPPKGGS
jgi:hypothetical protein